MNQREEQIYAILQEVDYKSNFYFEVEPTGMTDEFHLRAVHSRKDSITGEDSTGRSAAVVIPSHYTKDQIIRQAFRAVLSVEEHEARETFKYKGKAVFGPHISVDKLAIICG